MSNHTDTFNYIIARPWPIGIGLQIYNYFGQVHQNATPEEALDTLDYVRNQPGQSDYSIYKVTLEKVCDGNT